MVSKKILYIDMDGVLADFDKAIKSLDPELDIGDGDNWEERSKRVDQLCLENPHIFLDLEPMEDAISSVHTLNELYEIYILSTPMWALPECYMDKRKWLEKHFGDLLKHKLILTKRKDLNIGDYLIDDTTRNGVDKFKGQHIHFSPTNNWKVIIKQLIHV